MKIIYQGYLSHLQFTLAQGDIFDSATEAIVNSEQTDFILSPVISTISGQIRRRYGKEVQEQLDAATNMEILHAGTVIATSGGSDFRRIYHAGFHDPDDWPGEPGCSTFAEILETIGICVDQVLQMALEGGISSVAFPLIGCGLFEMDEEMLISQFLDSLHKCDKRMTGEQPLSVHLVIHSSGQMESVVCKLIDLLLASHSHTVAIGMSATGVPLLDRFVVGMGNRVEANWGKWQLCRFAEIALEVMCFGLCQAYNPPPAPETLFEEGLAASFGKVREHALRMANSYSKSLGKVWGASFFAEVLTDSSAVRALGTLNEERNNLAHGRVTRPFDEIQSHVNHGLRLFEWERAQDRHGPFRTEEWQPWILALSDNNNAIGLFERWQKSSIRYLVPETGEVFKTPRWQNGLTAS